MIKKLWSTVVCPLLFHNKIVWLSMFKEGLNILNKNKIIMKRTCRWEIIGYTYDQIRT